ncbi:MULTISPECIES: response regulator [Sphingosinicellaceae]|uniref:response regulator n=1 Tax=Sphingosinicellaceae TaxID=2820280 RepID=UPI001C1E3315|nr:MULTISPECIES: response regulator [Polymorphobacter]QYE33532.1 response regulator [Polymorphobacter sp. PAMC 29334]UAJ12226.1 response regulator [Polymorphobacter megasporae]
MKIDMRETLDVPEAIPLLLMVVDDEVLIRFVAADILRDAGFAVVEAGDADEAMILLATGMPCSLIFSDVNMPGSIDGVGLVAHVKEHYPVIPVVLTSGGVALHELVNAGAVAIVPKPYSESTLIGTIDRVLGRSGD